MKILFSHSELPLYKVRLIVDQRGTLSINNEIKTKEKQKA